MRLVRTITAGLAALAGVVAAVLAAAVPAWAGTAIGVSGGPSRTGTGHPLLDAALVGLVVGALTVGAGLAAAAAWRAARRRGRTE